MGSLSKQIRDHFEIAAQAGFSGLDLFDIEIAVGEAVTNAILYGSPSATSQIIINSHLSQSVFHVDIHDQGRGFDPQHLHPEQHSDSLGGRGIRLMRALMDEVDLYYNGQGMTARLSKKLALKIAAS